MRIIEFTAHGWPIICYVYTWNHIPMPRSYIDRYIQCSESVCYKVTSSPVGVYSMQIKSSEVIINYYKQSTYCKNSLMSAIEDDRVSLIIVIGLQITEGNSSTVNCCLEPEYPNIWSSRPFLGSPKFGRRKRKIAEYFCRKE